MFLSFIFGLIFGIVGGWFLLFYLIIKFGNKSLDKTKLKLSKINEENKEFLIKKSMSKAKSMSQRLLVQFAGKTKTRAEYLVSLGMYKLEFVATKLNNNPMDRGFAELAGCTIRLIGNKDSKLTKAIEILNPINKIFLNFDYLYLIFETSKDQINWYNDLSLVCTETQMESISNFSLERDMNKLLSYQQPTHFAKKGWAQIQAAENAKGRVWRYCLLENHILHHFGSKDISKTDMKRINLIDCDIFVNEDKKRFKITSKKREILESAEYIYFITTHERHDFADWKDALSSIPEHAKYYEETPLFRVNASSSMASFPHSISLPNIPSEVIYNTRESATWLNMIVERFMRNIKFSEALNNTIKEKIQKKLQEKVTMKGLNDFVSEIKVEKFYISSKLPTIIWAKPIKSKIEDKIMVDFMINLNCREDPIIIGIAATFTPFKKHFAEKKFSTQLELKMNSLLGKLHFECMPFPASRFSLSFYEEPSIDIKVCSSVSLPDRIKTLVEELLVKKMKVSLLEKFLMPNRKYFPIPKSQELSEKYLKKIMESTTLDEIEIEQQDDKTQVSEDFDFEDDDDINPPSMDVSEDTVFIDKKKN